MEAATAYRNLSGEQKQRIIDAMRASVAARGITGATFEVVAAEAGVSRELLQDDFGNEERLLAEVVRRDGEIRLSMLEAAMRGAETLADLVEEIANNLEQTIRDQPWYFVLLFELFLSDESNEAVRAELAALYDNARKMMAEVLTEKQRLGVVQLPSAAEDMAMHVVSSGERAAIQLLSDPERDFGRAFETATASPDFRSATADRGLDEWIVPDEVLQTLSSPSVQRDQYTWAPSEAPGPRQPRSDVSEPSESVPDADEWSLPDQVQPLPRVDPGCGDDLAPAQADLNLIGFEELRGMGLSLTQCARVLAKREELGAYGSTDELDDLFGFPAHHLERLKSKVQVRAQAH